MAFLQLSNFRKNHSIHAITFTTMRLRSALLYLAQAIALGLITALILSWLWPQLLTPPPVEIRRSGESPAARSGTGPVSYATAVDRAAPAVVNINTAKVITVRPHPFLDDPVFRQFFGRGADDLITPRRRVETSLGSGVIFSDQGHILTNHHVIRGADAIQVSLRDGRTAPATVVGSDPDSDLAVLKIDLKKLPVVTLGHSEQLRVGDIVLAIGNPFGVGQTVTMGIVSATGRSRLGINTFENFIQTDAAINPGNSGGALVDANGNLVGINSAIFSQSGGNLGIGFAIPVSFATGVFEDIVQHGRPLRGWLGISAEPITPEQARKLDLKSTEGVIVVGVLRNGPAHRAGLRAEDIILAIDDKKIMDARDALLAISKRRPGSKVALKIQRDGQELMLEMIAIERPQRVGQTE
jgi:Do/DeqQ family serine protease